VGVSVFVMPLQTWLAGEFRTTWGPGLETATASRRRRPPEEAARLREELLSRIEPRIGRRPAWDDEGPARSATAFSVHAFSLPFLQARRWAYRMKLPQLGELETPQIWIPADFDPAFRLEPPWDDGGELMIGSLPRIRAELDQLLEGLTKEDEEGDWSELREVAKVGRSLRHLAATGLEHDVPVIVEE
jgi:hypothetical protein